MAGCGTSRVCYFVLCSSDATVDRLLFRDLLTQTARDCAIRLNGRQPELRRVRLAGRAAFTLVPGR